MIHPNAIVHAGARIGRGVEIGPFSIVHENVEIGDNTKIGASCEIGVETRLGDGGPLVIGADSLIRSHSVFYIASRFGPGLVTGHHVVVREGTNAGTSFQIGSFSDIQGDVAVGDFVRFQSNVFVGKMTKLGNFVWIMPNVIFTNDPTPPSNTLIGSSVGDFACISAGTIVLPGLKIGTRSLVGAGALVSRDVPDEMFAVGRPAKIIGKAQGIKLRDGTGRSAYPWTRHFQRGYPEDLINNWE